jgi:hypothetical protein
LLGPPGRYLVTMGSRDAGRMIVVEDCEDGQCMDVGNDTTLASSAEELIAPVTTKARYGAQ